MLLRRAACHAAAYALLRFYHAIAVILTRAMPPLAMPAIDTYAADVFRRRLFFIMIATCG